MDSGYANKEQCQKWLNKLPKECCFQCKFYHINDEAGLSVFKIDHATHEIVSVPGECRKKSPSLIQSHGEFVSSFPYMNAFEWCGDFVPNTETRGLDEIYSEPLEEGLLVFKEADQC